MKIKAILFLGLVLIFSGCSQSKKHKIGFLLSGSSTDRFNKESEYFKERANQLGAEVIINNEAESDAIQYEKALELFDDGIDALVIIAVNANTAASIVREGNSRGIKVIAYNRIIYNCTPDLFVSGDNAELGKLMVQEVTNKKKSGNVIILNGDKYDRNAIGLQQSIDENIKPYVESGAYKILFKTFIEDWSDANAAYEMKQFISLDNQKPDIIFAGYDGIADGVIKVLEENNMLDGVLITGQDAELRAIHNIIAGKQLMTVYHPLKTNAYTAAELTIDMLNNIAIPKDMLSTTFNGESDVPTVKIKSITVTKSNIDDVLIQQGVYTRKEVYN